MSSGGSSICGTKQSMRRLDAGVSPLARYLLSFLLSLPRMHFASSAPIVILALMAVLTTCTGRGLEVSRREPGACCPDGSGAEPLTPQALCGSVPTAVPDAPNLGRRFR